MATKKSKVVILTLNIWPFKHAVTWQIKTLYSLYNNTYGQQICQGGDILQGAPTHKFEWPLN